MEASLVITTTVRVWMEIRYKLPGLWEAGEMTREIVGGHPRRR